jgi:tRNA threonylcarbamoyladenosine biosynthesis protein TsaB
MDQSGRTLVIETASEACSIALFEGGELLVRDHRVLGRGHAERLIPMIEALPDKGRADTILTSLGPGSFTGVRIGIAAARALGVAWSVQVRGYPTLALIAAIARHKATSDLQDNPAGVTVCVNGGHGEWFVQDFGRDGLAQTTAASITPQDAAVRDNHRCIAGNRAEELAQHISDTAIRALPILPDASHARLLPDACLTDDLTPIYGRAPDAKPQAKGGLTA